MSRADFRELIKSNKASIYNVTHIADFDGMGSAAMFMHYAGVPKERIFFGNYMRQDIDKMISELKAAKLRNSFIIFTDMSVNDSAIDVLKGLMHWLKGEGNKVAWIDHHPWSDSAVSEVGSECIYLVAGENKNYCATELVYKELFENEADKEYGTYLANIAHYADFNIRNEQLDPLLFEITGAITYINYNQGNTAKLRDLVSEFAKGNYKNSITKEAYASYLKDSELNIKALEESLEKHSVGNLILGIGYSKHLGSTQACTIIADELKADIAIFVNTDSGKVSLRSGKAIDCSKLAVALGGGGHPQAAGCEAKIESGEDWKELFSAKVLEEAAKIYGR